ncbi:haloacid dehalogenase [Spirochaetia bacterium]|nr:haloacid dehalogenase [Spirochaetia bacterium]
MKIFRLPKNPAALIFDMDGTLYTNDEYMRSQLELPVKKLAALRGKSFNEMQGAIKQYQDDWAAQNPGKRISLGNTFKAFGVSIEETIQWREMLYDPERYLTPDPKLRQTVTLLAASYKMAVVTNNPVSVARRTLACLGIDDRIPIVVGLDTCKVSKPHEAPFRTAAEICGVPVNACVSIGDRYEIDIALPLEMGMGGILVDGVEDVYGVLPYLLFDSF